ncbi:MAG: energy transducer TonB [Sphingomonas sp.]|uniref:energy transducer TonB n=1 Tax=Sphingomonas sp. TaxID=28214 RepID=UPI0025D67513|nr:energy transducer TonB [Sphingomonas sp.]MBX3563014.1 energy transducer TonB [Sphingomonas sp.]
MYADTRYVPRTPRSVSLGGSLAISGLLIAGLMSFVPNIIPKKLDGPMTLVNIKDPVPPPPEPEIKPETQPQARQPDIFIPTPPIPQPQQPQMQGTDVLPLDPPPTGPLVAPGPGPTIAEPPAPLPPLIGAQQDPRFARDYQPEYPAQELRAQRDGKVAVRVLIGTDGRVKAVEQVSATSAAFFEATKRQALSKWRFKPATRGGVPQESWKTMSVRFELSNA